MFEEFLMKFLSIHSFASLSKNLDSLFDVSTLFIYMLTVRRTFREIKINHKFPNMMFNFRNDKKYVL